MRFATILEGDRAMVAVVRGGRYLPLAMPGELGSIASIAAAGDDGLRRIRDWVARQPEDSDRSVAGAVLGPVVPEPGAIYTIGRNYGPADEPDGDRPQRPLVFAKLPTAVTGHGATVSWDRALTRNVDPECELGVVIGETPGNVAPEGARRHVFGYTCINAS